MPSTMRLLRWLRRLDQGVWLAVVNGHVYSGEEW